MKRPLCFSLRAWKKLQRVHKSGKKCLSAFSRVIQLLLLTDVHVTGFYFKKKKTIKVNELKKEFLKLCMPGLLDEIRVANLTMRCETRYEADVRNYP